jgi:hypothetical protein
VAIPRTIARGESANAPAGINRVHDLHSADGSRSRRHTDRRGDHEQTRTRPVVLAAVAAAATGAFAQTVPAAADSWVSDRHPNRNYGTDTALRTAQKPLRRAYVRFLRAHTRRNGAKSAAAIAGPGARSFVITAPNARREAFFASRESGRAPELVITTESTPPPTASSNTSVPTVSGTPQQGQTLTATTGSWSGSTPITYSYQWQRCTSSGSSCTTITGATGASYVPLAGDVGSTIRVRVTATNSVGLGVRGQRPDRGRDCGRSGARPGARPRAHAGHGDHDDGTVEFAGARSRTSARFRSRSSRRSRNPATTTRSTCAVATETGIRRRSTSSWTSGEKGGTVGTAYDAVRIGLDAHDLVVTGNVECGARHTDPSIHQDIVQALSGSRITFVDFTSGDPSSGRWTCWGAGGGWYVTWANGSIPTDLGLLALRPRHLQPEPADRRVHPLRST